MQDKILWMIQMNTMTRTYSELIQNSSFEERFHYLALHGSVGKETFGFDRWINQGFYTSREWKQIRQFVIARDEGRDLAMPGRDIFDRIIIHHMNPMLPEHIVHADETILDPEFLITTTHRTHNAIHYGDERLLPRQLVDRAPGDTKLW